MFKGDSMMKNWKPKNYETYYYVHFTCFNNKFSVLDTAWYGTSLDWALYNAGVIHKTFEEAEACMKEDFEKLTGREWSEEE